MKKFLLFLLLTVALVLLAQERPALVTIFGRGLIAQPGPEAARSYLGISTNGTDTNGIIDINGLAGYHQTLTVNTNASGFGVTSSGTNHAVNIPVTGSGKVVLSQNPVFNGLTAQRTNAAGYTDSWNFSSGATGVRNYAWDGSLFLSETVDNTVGVTWEDFDTGATFGFLNDGQGFGAAAQQGSAFTTLDQANGLYAAKIQYSDVWHVDSSGNDSTAVIGDSSHPWQTISNAVLSANSFRNSGNQNTFVIWVHYNGVIYDMGDTPIQLTNHIIFRGDGTNATRLFYGGGEHSEGPAIRPSDDCLIEYITIALTNGSATDQTAFGVLSDFPNYGTNYMVGCKVTGGAHAIQLNPGLTNGIRSIISAWDCYFSNPNAPAQVLGTNNFIELHNCFLEAIGPELRGRSFSAGLENFGGSLKAWGCYFHVVGASGADAIGYTTELTGSVFAPGQSLTNGLNLNVFDVTSAGGSPSRFADILVSTNTSTTYSSYNKRADGTALVYTLTHSATVTYAGDIDDTEIRHGSGRTYALLNTTNPITLNTKYTNGTTAGFLTVNFLLSEAIGGNAGLIFTNLSCGDWEEVTNNFSLAANTSGEIAKWIGPNEIVLVTNISSGGASASVKRSFLRK